MGRTSGRFSSETYAGLTHRLRDTLGATGIDETENLETKLKALTMTQPVDQSLIDTLTGLNAEATFGLDTDDYDGSVKFQQQLRETSLKHLGEEHPFTISVINRLAHSLRLLDPQESLELRDQALKLTTKSRGAEHSESMLTVMNFAEALADVGRTEEALASGTQVLEARIRMSGEDHRETIRVILSFHHGPERGGCIISTEGAGSTEEEIASRSPLGVDGSVHAGADHGEN